MGLLLAVVVHSASLQDRDGAKLVLKKIRPWFKRLKLIWADGGYAGKLIRWAQRYCRLKLEIVKRSDSTKGFKILPKRWIVERTFGWLNRYRRLSKDYELDPKTSETMIYLALSHLMLKRLFPH